MKNRLGITLLLLGSLLFLAFPASGQENAPLQPMYEEYLNQQEHTERVAEIEMSKDAFVQNLAGRWEAEALEKGNDNTWYDRAVTVMSEQDAETLLLMSEADTWDELIWAIDGVSPLALGSPTSELVFYPLDPCRIVDTRIASKWLNQPIPPSTSYIVQTWPGQPTQGGSATTCGVSSDAAAVAINVTAVPVSGTGNLRVYPYLASLPNAATLNYATGVQNIANAVIAKNCRLCTNEIEVWSSQTSHVVIDVLGYFARPAATPLQRTILTSSLVVNNGVLAAFLESPSCPAGYTAVGGGCHFNHSHPGLHINGTRPFNPTTWHCAGSNNSGFNSGLNAHVVCARVPGG